ncbi:helix-turn-helix domain-containing protein [Treponema phagedenis]|uniref:Helix-turn-helix transcriptional regulator n=1 Tax=Treponema phagedenis TaxID=162 RepID=A0AAE6IUY8_TREPH|nr:helix-turn-helix transcriptional regulator [Treponema phagedenis]EFW38674.1 hypothetical protein HMPREF9554_00851 [Treponema phagedenis F0421]QEJ98678.1 helix-turn-helix transcriptional regulator [Treponema phagedenis]QEK04184.1 helix-turn-helix transcriptional regulator [Treponema phagedenis]QEK09800.1 helix-turn-helix transcriptional regulator [Treponema phagedenis]TYT79732.1 helix-turn-helix transcriptional regulator [Treponema phagedenis]
MDMRINSDVFYENIKTLVRTKNITIEKMIFSIDDLSIKALSTYNSMRQAGNLPRADDVLRIADFFGVSVEYLVTGKEKDNAPKITETKDLLLKAIENLDTMK